MNKSDLITLLQSAECGSDELNVAYYEWKYPNKTVWAAINSVVMTDLNVLNAPNEFLPDVSNSVDAALGEILEKHGYWLEHEERMNGEWLYEACIRTEDDRLYGRSKSLPIAILLAVVEAAP